MRKIRCPFKNVYFGGYLKCVYLDKDTWYCDDIEVCPVNSDSFCAEAVEEKLQRTTNKVRRKAK
jgi:hypothetical protein